MRKSKHNLSNFELTTASMGKLYPVNLREVLPNDTFIGRTDCFARMQPLVRPIMHPIKIIFQHWYCPSRILWEDFEEFYTQGGIEETYPVYPTIKFEEAVSAGSLANRLGVPTGQKNLEVSALPFRMYNLIWNDRYRNQELEEPVSIGYESGIDTVTRTELLSPLWSRDYFTTSMLSTQLGSRVAVPTSQTTEVVTSNQGVQITLTSVSIFVGRVYQSSTVTGITYVKQITDFEVTFSKDFVSSLSGDSLFFDFSLFGSTKGVVSGNSITWTSSRGVSLVARGIPIASNYNFYLCAGSSVPQRPVANRGSISFSLGARVSTDSPVSKTVSFSPTSPSVLCVFAPGSYSRSYIDLRDLATATHLQKLKEKAEIYGNRYEERLQREFGLRPRDGRIARPEYLGGSSQTFQTSEVLQTAEAENSGVGNMRGHGVSLSSSNRFRFRFPEHGWFMTLMSIRPISIYTQGIDRQLLRRSPTDHYLPDLANAGGMQEVWQEELYATETNKGVVFGYQGLYDDYRQARSRVTGDFLTTEQDWHLARLFSAPPVLNQDFVSMSKGDFSRIFNVTDTSYDTLLFMINNHLKAYRPIPKRIKPTHIG